MLYVYYECFFLFLFFFFNIYLFIYLVAPGLIYLFIFIFIFGCVGSSFLCEGFLQLRRAGATLHCGAWASSLSRPLLLRSTGSRHAGSVAVCGSRAQPLCGMWDPPRPGLEPVSPALAGRFSTTAPPGKPSFFF